MKEDDNNNKTWEVWMDDKEEVHEHLTEDEAYEMLDKLQKKYKLTEEETLNIGLRDTSPLY